jgi:hypothetical protein
MDVAVNDQEPHLCEDTSEPDRYRIFA